MRNEDYGRKFFYGWAIAFGAVTILLNGVEAVRLNSGSGWDAVGAAFTGALPPVILLVTSHAVIKVVRHTVGQGREVSGGVWIGILLGLGALGSAVMAFGGSFKALEALAAYWGWAVPSFLPLSIDTALIVMSLGSVWSAMMLARAEQATAQSAVSSTRPDQPVVRSTESHERSDEQVDQAVDRPASQPVAPPAVVDPVAVDPPPTVVPVVAESTATEPPQVSGVVADSEPVVVDQVVGDQPSGSEPVVADEAVADQLAVDPVAVQPPVVEPVVVDQPANQPPPVADLAARVHAATNATKPVELVAKVLELASESDASQRAIAAAAGVDRSLVSKWTKSADEIRRRGLVAAVK